MARFPRGLKPFDPVKHARFGDAQGHYGFTYATPVYPIDKSAGITNFDMDGNGPDPTLTGPFARFASTGVGCCAVAEFAHAQMIAAVLAGLPLAENTMTANQVLTLYFTYEAEQAGATWDPTTPPDPSWDVGVDLGDFLLWLVKHGHLEAFVAIQDLSQVDAALATFDIIVGGWALTDQTDEDFENGVVADVSPTNQPDPNEGHCFGIIGVESRGGVNSGDTWGGVLRFTNAYRSACLQQAFAVITLQEATAKGFVDQYNAIRADLLALGGTVASTPPAAPRPAPAPAAQPSFWSRVKRWLAGF